MPRGGARVGAGRKKKRLSDEELSSPPPVLSVIDGGKSKDDSAVTAHVSPVPPKDLPEDQRDFWRRYAGLAIEARTLTPRTVAAFRLLCELEAEKQATKATLDRDGRTYIKAFCDSSGQEHQELKAHPLTGSYRQLAQRVEALLARFGLAPFGKAIGPATTKSAAEQQKAANHARFFGGQRG